MLTSKYVLIPSTGNPQALPMPVWDELTETQALDRATGKDYTGLDLYQKVERTSRVVERDHHGDK